LSAFAEGLKKAADVANSEPFRSNLVTLFRAAGDAADILNGSVGNLLKTLGGASDVLGGFFREGSGVVAAFVDNITAALTHSDLFAGVYVGLHDFKVAMQNMEPGFIHLGNMIGTIGRIAGEVFTAMAPGFNAITETLDNVFANLAPGIEAVIPIFNAFVQSVLAVATGPIEAIASAVGGLLTAFAGLPTPIQLVIMALGLVLLLRPKLEAMFSGMGSSFGTFRSRIDGDVDGLGKSTQNMYKHFGTARDGINHASNALRTMPFAAATSGMGGLATSAGSALKGIGAAAGSGLRGALSGGAALLGGPWGIALAGATAAIGLFGAAQEESKAKVEALSGTLDKQTGNITNATKGMLGTNALDGATDGWDDFWRGMMQGSKSTEETLSILGTTTKEYIDRLADSRSRDDYIKGFERIREAMRNGVPVTEEMAKAVGSTKEALSGLNDDDIAHLGEKAKTAAAELSKAEEKVRKLAEATGLTSARATIFATNLETLGSASSSASDKFGALKSNLDLLNGGMNGIVNTKKGLAQALADSSNGLKELTKGGEIALNSLYSVKDGFDFTTQAGRDFHTSLETSTDAILKNGTAAMDQALKSGKSATEANSIAIQAMQPGIKSLRDQLSSLGVEQPKIDDIIRSFGLMPDQIATAVQVNGTEEAQRKIFLTKLAADSFASGKYESVLGALPESAKKAIADATGKGKEYAAGDYDAVLEALDHTAGGKEAALAAILSVTNGNYEAAIRGLNLTGPAAELAKAKLLEVQDRSITIRAVDGVSDTVYTVRTQLASLKDKSVNITTYYSSASTGEAGSGRQTAGGMDGAILSSVSGRSSLFQGAFPMQKLTKYANGGVENHQAQFAKAGAMRLWAEPETGGEAYIPLAKSKRGRSLKILEEVARIFGFGIHNMKAFADGGIEKTVTQSVSTSSSTAAGLPAINFNVHPTPGLSEKQIGEAAAAELFWQLTNRR
jgi:Sec-independent protein translocase protein TatA